MLPLWAHEENDNGFLQAKIDKDGKYLLTYEKTFAMKFANYITLISILGVIIIAIRTKKERKDA